MTLMQSSIKLRREGKLLLFPLNQIEKSSYKDRNLIEQFFCQLKKFRGIATRYYKRGRYFLEAVKFASSIIFMT